MPVEPVEGSVRERRRAETVREIKAAALEQLAEGGPRGLSLRGVARGVGMTVQSLYHYFDSRDALLTALMIDGHLALAVALRQSADASVGQPHAERLFAVTNAYRHWALTNRARFLLLYGTPMPGYDLPRDERVTAAALNQAGPFVEVVFDGWSAEQVAKVPLQPGAERLAANPGKNAPVPPGALALFFELRAQMHGLVMLDLGGYLAPMSDHAEDLLRGMMNRAAQQLAAMREAVE